MKRLLPAALLFVSVAGVAGEFSYTKSVMPPSIIKPGSGTATSMHTMPFQGYPRGAYGISRLASVSWNTTFFPTNTGETVELCVQTWRVIDCRPIAPNAAGNTPFNVPFEISTQVLVRHSTTHGPRGSRPAGRNTVTLHFKY